MISLDRAPVRRYFFRRFNCAPKKRAGEGEGGKEEGGGGEKKIFSLTIPLSLRGFEKQGRKGVDFIKEASCHAWKDEWGG